MKALQPFHQGQLDFFCAVYAVINALRLTGDVGLADGRNILADSLREVAARPLLWEAVLTNQTDYYWLLRWMFGHFGRESGFEFKVGRLPAAPLSRKQRRILTRSAKAGAARAGLAARGDALESGDDFSPAIPVGYNAKCPDFDFAGDAPRELLADHSGIEGKTVADALHSIAAAGSEQADGTGGGTPDTLFSAPLPGDELDSLLSRVPLDGQDRFYAPGPDGFQAQHLSAGSYGGPARENARGLYGLTDDELCAWVGLARPAKFCLDSVTRDDLFLQGDAGGFGRELKWNMEELWPLLQSWLPVKSLFGSFNVDRRRKRCLILRFHRHLYASHPPLISHWSVGKDFQRETLHLFDCTADKNAIHSLPLRECVLSELQLAPDRLLRLEPDSVFFIEKI